jgi:hypothetical protein
MSRYLLLFLLNLPFILAGMLSAITQYKLGHASRRRMIILICLWAIILTGLALAEPLYTWLFTNNLTVSEPLSLFDVIQITAIVIVFYMANRSIVKVAALEKRVQDLHQELSIQLSKDRARRS